jgi:hypothetical protein
MESNQLLDHLFFINYELKFEDADLFFGKLGFHNTTREESILSYMGNDSNYTLHVTDQKIMNGNFSTTKEIDLKSILNHAESHFGFTFEKEEDNIISYKKDNLRLHVRMIPAFAKMLYAFYLFEHVKNRVEVIMTPPPPVS